MKYFLILMCALTLTACGGTKTTSSNTGDAKDLEIAKLVSSYYNNTLEYNTLAARMKVRYKDRKNGQTVTVSLRMEKDKTIWMSASILGISLAKAMVTPTKVAYYEKIGGTYFEGDFEFLSQYFGVEMNFDQLQRLLVGETVYDLRIGKYEVSTVNNQYIVIPEKQLELLNLFFFIAPQDFVLKKQTVTQPSDNLSMNVEYLTHQQVSGKNFPKNIHIEVLENTDKTTIDIDYRSIEYNAEVRFPFKIPSGYTELKF